MMASLSPATRRKLKRLTPARVFWGLLQYAILVTASLIILVPLWLTFMASFKAPLEMMRTPKTAAPGNWFNFENYVEFAASGMLALTFGNTLFLIVGSVAIVSILGTMTAYVIDRFSFRGRNAILIAYLLVMAIPGVTTQISIYQIMLNAGLVNTRSALLILYSGTDIIALYIMITFLKSISKELDESARLEGAGYLTVYWKIILPLMIPAISTIAILKTIGVYNDFLMPYLYTPDVSKSTVSMLLFQAAGQLSASTEAVLMAGIVMVIAPAMIAFFVLQRQIVSGMMRGAVKF